jgi:antitoxin component HigA of HigAB toxin-antitoxin module
MSITTRKRSADTYFELVHAFPLRRLGSAAELIQAGEIYLRLSKSKADRGTRDYLDVLADLIAEYEKRTNQTIDTSHLSAADLIQHRLEERGMSVSALAREIGQPQSNLSDMLNGRRDWSKPAIRALAKMFNIRAERFLV